MPSVCARAQEQKTGTREVISEDFTNSRPKASTSKPRREPSGEVKPKREPPDSAGKAKREPAASAYTPPKRRHARPYRRVTSPAHTASGAAPERPGQAHPAVEQIGITLWRLRPSAPSDGGPTISVIERDGGESRWTPERVESDAQLDLGERVRLTVESPRAGYLYVIDREEFADGTLGEARLIFPTTRTRGGENRVRAGLLIDIPAQEDGPPYFTLKSSRPGYVGERLTVILTAQPLDGLAIGRQPLRIPAALLEGWEKEWGAAVVERFELEDGAGAAWTAEEQTASRVNGRELTQDEPSPQTIYRVAARPGTPLLVPVQLRARTSK